MVKKRKQNRERRRFFSLLVLGMAIGLAALLLPRLDWKQSQETPPSPPERYDLIVRGGLVYDGSGNAPRRADVGIVGDKIVAVADLSKAEAKKRIDATGLAVAPGFIDPHNHTWDTLPEYPTDPDAKSMLMQGITTVIGGVDGRSRWPIGVGLREIEQTGTGVNFGTMAGQGTIRAAVMGSHAQRQPTTAELTKMQQMVEQAMNEGAFGLSTGLEYEGMEANTTEIVALATAAARRGGIYSTHVRSERDDLLAGVREALQIGRSAGLPVNLSHLKLVTPAQHQQAESLIATIAQARAEGQQVFADVYPYLATDYLMNLPLADVYRTYPPEQIYIRKARRADLVGKTLADVALQLGQPAQAAAASLLKEDPSIRVAAEAGREDLLIRLIQANFAVAGTDGEAQPWYNDPDRVASLVHPRSYGSYPKYLRLVREQKILSLELMIHKMTGAIADALHLKDRGYIRPGYYADLVLFDAQRVRDTATWAEPQQYPEGIRWVLVNGQTAVADGQHQGGARFGRILRHKAP